MINYIILFVLLNIQVEINRDVKDLWLYFIINISI